MDILHLIDRLEELFNESRAIPFTHNVIVDEEKMLDLIDQMREGARAELGLNVASEASSFGARSV